MRAFDWYENQLRRMTLNSHYALHCTKHASFGAHHENLNEDTTHTIRDEDVHCVSKKPDPCFSSSVDQHLSPASGIHDAVHGAKCRSQQG